jgi:hypothetical protein
MSPTTGPTIAAAQHLAAVLGAQLRVLHVIEPFPKYPETLFRLSEPAYRRHMTEQFGSRRRCGPRCTSRTPIAS